LRYIPREEWDSHPILSRLSYKSDFDGDGTFHLHNYDSSEFSACMAITIEVSEDLGASWKRATFYEDIVYIDRIGAGWPWLGSGHPYDELFAETRGKSGSIWRAFLTS
jgi:hypothetical protein